MEHPIKLYCREYGISQKALAAQAGLSYSYLNQIVNGHETCGRRAALSLSAVTGGYVQLADILTWQPEEAA